MTSLFDPGPIRNRSLLFGRDTDYKKLETAINDNSRLIVIVGLRRVGKTSLIKSLVATGSYYYIYVDLRETGVDEELTKHEIMDFFRIALEKFLENNVDKTLLSALNKVQGIKIGGHAYGIGGNVTIQKFDHDKLNLSELFTRLNDWATKKNKNILLIVDEAHEFSKVKNFNMAKIFAGVYDNYHSIKIILTGSEISLLYKFLDVDNDSSVLYHRELNEIPLKSFDHALSKQFLTTGFQDEGMGPLLSEQLSIIDEAAEILRGRVGWLSQFGSACVKDGKCITKEKLYEIRDKIIPTVKKELNTFLKIKNRENYQTIIEYLANSDSNYYFIEYFVNRSSTKNCVADLLKNNFIQKDHDGIYSISDPILKYTLISSDYSAKKIKIEKIAQNELAKST